MLRHVVYPGSVDSEHKAAFGGQVLGDRHELLAADCSAWSKRDGYLRAVTRLDPRASLRQKRDCRQGDDCPIAPRANGTPP